MTGMKSTFQVINRMVADGVIGTYAVGGAVAALNYIEPMLTYDLDVLISVDQLQNQPSSGLVTLEPVFAYLRNAGYREFKKEGIVIEGWPVQFLPVASDLDAESLAQAVTVELKSVAGHRQSESERSEPSTWLQPLESRPSKGPHSNYPVLERKRRRSRDSPCSATAP
jgi:hypothetical protein